MRHWWVNHRQTPRQELEGSYLWSATKNKAGVKNVSHDNMTRAVPGDVVFSCADNKIGAVGVVTNRARSTPAPAEAHAAEPGQTAAGWLLPVRFESLSRPLVPKAHMAELAPLLPAKHSPLRASGVSNRSVYLAEIPATLAAALERLLGGQIHEIAAEVTIETDDQLTDSAIEEEIWQRSDLRPGEKRQLVNARIGQGIFRENVERLEQSCRVTGVLDRRHLRASHIKPWKLADDREKLDGFNGLLLAPHINHLFDRGHISFSNDGRMLVSEYMNPTVMRAWGLLNPRPPHPFRPEQCAYLEFHRRTVFEKVAAGRRNSSG